MPFCIVGGAMLSRKRVDWIPCQLGLEIIDKLPVTRSEQMDMKASVRTVWSSACASICVVAKLVDVHSSLCVKIVAGNIPWNARGWRFIRLVKCDSAFDCRIAADNSHYIDGQEGQQRFQQRYCIIMCQGSPLKQTLHHHSHYPVGKDRTLLMPSSSGIWTCGPMVSSRCLCSTYLLWPSRNYSLEVIL